MLNFRYMNISATFVLNELQSIVQQIPVDHNFVSHVILLGVVQGLFLSGVILLRFHKNTALNFLGWSLLCQSLVFFDVYLCYTGLMKYALHFNDSTEPLVLLIAPTFYLFVHRLIKREPFNLKKHWWHFVLPLFYIITQIPYYNAPLAVKLNAYLGAYHSEIEYVSVPESFDYSYHWIKNHFDQLVLASIFFYSILALRLVWQEYKRRKAAPHMAKVKKYLFSRNSAMASLLFFICLFFVFYSYDDDSGDHFLGILFTIIIFVTSAAITLESRVFEKSWAADKYETYTSSHLSISDIEEYIAKEKYHLEQDASLKGLAKELNVSPNLVSKVINANTDSNFNDYLNKKRIEEAKEKFKSGDYRHLTIEAIGSSVGFRSKSAFYTAFKKHTGLSPAGYIKAKTSP